MDELKRLKETRATLLAAAKEMLARAQARPEGERDLTGEENAKIDEHYAEFDRLGKRVETLERMTRLERAEAQLADVTRRTQPADPDRVGFDAPAADLGEGVRAWFLRSTGRLTHEQQLNASRCGIDLGGSELTIRYNPASGAAHVANASGDQIRRDMLTTAGTSALVSWKEFYDGYDKAEKFYGNALNLVTRIKTETGVNLPIPTFDDTSNRGRWLGEGTTATNTDTTPGVVTLSAWKASSDQVPISIELLQDGQVSMNTILPMLLGERIGRLKNQAITVGTGSSQPYGIITQASASSVVIGGTNASPTYSWDDMLSLKYSVDPAYRKAPADKRGFMVSDTLLAKYRKLKDGQSRYFADPFAPGPGTIDGDPIFLNNDVLATGVNAKVAAYGDYSRYFFREVMEITFYRLDQIKILDGKIVFMAISRCDGNLINTGAVKTLANPAS